MELTSVDNRVIIPNERQADTLSLSRVSEVLEKILAGQNEDILVEARSQDFFYDPGTGIDTNHLLKAAIGCEKIIVKEDTIEITLSGTVENKQGQKDTCTLYFSMWWDNTTVSALKNGYRKALCTKSMQIHLKNRSKQLSDSIFELGLYREDLSGQRHYLGQGRGYLVFGRKA